MRFVDFIAQLTSRSRALQRWLSSLRCAVCFGEYAACEMNVNVGTAIITLLVEFLVGGGAGEAG